MLSMLQKICKSYSLGKLLLITFIFIVYLSKLFFTNIYNLTCYCHSKNFNHLRLFFCQFDNSSNFLKKIKNFTQNGFWNNKTLKLNFLLRSLSKAVGGKNYVIFKFLPKIRLNCKISVSNKSKVMHKKKNISACRLFCHSSVKPYRCLKRSQFFLFTQNIN